MEQTRIDEPDLVEWRCIAGHTNWSDNTFSFHIRPSDDETSLKFVQHYAQELDDDTYETHNFNWGYYLNSLKQLRETGSGTPHEVAGSL